MYKVECESVDSHCIISQYRSRVGTLRESVVVEDALDVH